MGDPMMVPRLRKVRGPVARSSTWWGRAFVRSFEETAFGQLDLRDARTLARSGKLGAVMVLSSMASVVVELPGDRTTMAQAKVEPLVDWDAFVVEAAREIGFVADLEAGRLPPELVEHADEVGVELLPAAGDVETACECDAWAQPCVHALALLYQLAWHVDQDPYVLLLLRGRTREWLLEALGAGSGPGGAPDEVLDSMERARRLLELAEDAPTGHGLADSAVASYDEEVSRLL
jgi:uncharacterized Zn finger protein